MTTVVRSSINKLHNFCNAERYVGYSLYDSHNSPIPFKKFGVLPSFIINQIIKRSPINFRPLLGINKGINPKGYGLFLHAYTKLSGLDIIDSEEAADRAHYFYNWLIDHPSSGYSGYCWGYNYHWPKKDGHDVPAYTPSVVVTGFVARALLAYYEAFKAESVRKILKSASEFVLNDVHLYKGDDGYCFSYTPVVPDLTVNANLLAAEVLAYSDYVNGENEHREYIAEAIRFTLNNQNTDGSWYYSFNYNTRKPKNQIDFHQGYVLESLYRLAKYSGIEDPYKDCTFQKALDFYYTKQFDRQGRAYWRLPSKLPIDIHNQSQGIITFSTLKDYNQAFLPFARLIAEWTIKYMQGSGGNFYYQKWPIITNKVNYLRWNQAWMLLALTTLMENDT
jgi:hypothetical protein